MIDPIDSIPMEVSPQQVKARLDAGEPLQLIDVREPQEHGICHIQGAILIPMQTIPHNLNLLDNDEPALVVYCHHGVRSLAVVDWLRRQGVSNCQSMAGGIDLWSTQIDPSVPRY